MGAIVVTPAPDQRVLEFDCSRHAEPSTSSIESTSPACENPKTLSFHAAIP